MTGLVTALAPPLAHHTLVVALPFFGPMLVIGVVIAAMAMRDRRRHER